MKNLLFGILSFVLFLFVSPSFSQTKGAGADKCIACHKDISAGLFKQWQGSPHGKADVACLDCHGAEKSDADAFLHYDAQIATLVTPKDCGKCHEQEMREVDSSYHATAGLILESQDAYLAHVAGGNPVAVTGCESCHGAKIKIATDSPNKLSKESWPNSGIGRINPDGSKGSCNACHTRHAFSKAQARQPQSCSKCHLGPDHPQKEIYEESKHGNVYFTHTEEMNLNSDSWMVGEDYFAAPTCATCHMSATKMHKFSHDVGQRIAWTLRPVRSDRKENWQARRDNMKDVCSACHGKAFVDGHFYQFDAVVRLYNEKFAKPASEIMTIIKKRNILQNKADFGNKIEWSYYELWHHEGRRARHGVSMMGPDYTWWHGFYEVAQSFYFKFIPDAREFNNSEVNAYVDKLLADDPMHQWLHKSTDELKNNIRSGKMQQIYKKFFDEGKKE